MAFCVHCGSKMADGEKFCTACGKPAKKNPNWIVTIILILIGALILGFGIAVIADVAEDGVLDMFESQSYDRDDDNDDKDDKDNRPSDDDRWDSDIDWDDEDDEWSSDSDMEWDDGYGKGTIAVIAKGETHAFWQAVKAGAEAAAAEKGYTITFRGPTAESEEFVSQQREMVQAALNNPDVKAIVLATIGLGFSDELISAYEKFIPVVEFDSGLYAGGADITEGKDPTIGSVATDNYALGAFAATNFYNALKARGVLADGYKVGIIQHDFTATGIDRAGGFEQMIKALAEDDGITLEINKQIKGYNPGEYKLGLTALKDWGAQAIFMTNEGVVNEAFSEVSDNAAYNHILFCGVDAGTNQYEWIKDAGANYALLVGSVAQDSYSVGYKSVELAIAKLEGREVKDVGVPGVWYNADNIDALRNQNIVYMG